MRPCVATVGTFDGIHIGHRAILSKVASLAAEKGLMSRVITFLNHPLSAIAPDRAPLWALQRKLSISAIQSHIERVSEMEFTPELAALTARQFLSLIKERFNVEYLVMGYDNTFGSDRLRERQQYIDAGRDVGIDVIFVDAMYTPDGLEVSSSLLRKSIAVWDIRTIRNILGAWPLYSATVVEGRHLGRKLGFPTMNLLMPRNIVPIPDGVYAAAVFLNPENPEESLPAVLSVGTNPTIAPDNPKTFELHVPGRKLGDMYGKTLFFLVGSKIRDILKFDSADSLVRAIKSDIKIAKSLYNQ